MVRPLPIGVQDFKKVRDEEYLYVDKTDMIPQILSQKSEVYLYTRPRRFGKSLNLSMLDAFFNLKYSKDNSWFDGLKVSDCRECDEHRNAYPVIYMDFKDLDAPDLDLFLDKLRRKLSKLYGMHGYLEDSEQLDRADTYAPNSGEPALYISKKCEDEGRLEAALKFLHFMTDANSGAQIYVDAVMLGTCIDGVVLPEEMIALQDVVYGDYRPSKLINCFKFNAEVGNLYWGMYTKYLDPSSDMTSEEFIGELKAELLPYLEEAIEEYTTYDVLSYADQVK